jgi:hypothetical protein
MAKIERRAFLWQGALGACGAGVDVTAASQDASLLRTRKYVLTIRFVGATAFARRDRRITAHLLDHGHAAFALIEAKYAPASKFDFRSAEHDPSLFHMALSLPKDKYLVHCLQGLDLEVIPNPSTPPTAVIPDHRLAKFTKIYDLQNTTRDIKYPLSGSAVTLAGGQLRRGPTTGVVGNSSTWTFDIQWPTNNHKQQLTDVIDYVVDSPNPIPVKFGQLGNLVVNDDYTLWIFNAATETTDNKPSELKHTQMFYDCFEKKPESMPNAKTSDNLAVKQQSLIEICRSGSRVIRAVPYTELCYAAMLNELE